MYTETKECGVQKVYEESITGCNYALVTENEYTHHNEDLLIIFHLCVLLEEFVVDCGRERRGWREFR